MTNVPVTFYIAGALLAIIVLRRVAPVVAALLGVGLALAIGGWGGMLYAQGAAPGFLGRPIPLVGFVAFVLVLIALEALNLSIALKRRRARLEVQARERSERDAPNSQKFENP